MTALASSALLFTALPAKRRHAPFENIVMELTFHNPTATARDVVVAMASDGRDVLGFELSEPGTGRLWEGREQSIQSLILYQRRTLAPRSSLSVACDELVFRTEGRNWHRGLPPGRYIIQCNYEPSRARKPGPPLMTLRSPPAEVVVKD